LAPFVAIGSALVAIFGLFSSGPSTEEIMKRMGKLIEKLADHLDKRFTVIEGMISQVTKQIAADFSQLENELGAFYKDTMKNFTLLAKAINSLMDSANRIEVQLKLISNKIDKGFQVIYMKIL